MGVAVNIITHRIEAENESTGQGIDDLHQERVGQELFRSPTENFGKAGDDLVKGLHWQSGSVLTVKAIHVNPLICMTRTPFLRTWEDEVTLVSKGSNHHCQRQFAQGEQIPPLNAVEKSLEKSIARGIIVNRKECFDQDGREGKRRASC
jgi:hypothetical protein